eukprot:CAMPEP_0204315026 /NCGR_PEP_ID=MMETSP0469-20131031/4577_1 /ASSEMBLY_ACC=CAM_ASM_000384 /TAXON_ID=2969 /ORGANISM="Oxyrrhis marina" /LENGTH=543 /DNA_ID=CAMNT_0051295611 /DNA_START=1 /DNA_END=1632 /DNA_ORIENTATION=+
MLSGTVPINYRGAQYNIPVTLYLDPPYPSTPPRVFVTPTGDMGIKDKHPAVGDHGMIWLSYLDEWRPLDRDNSNLVELVTIIIGEFSKRPPVYAKPAKPQLARASAEPQENQSEAQRLYEVQLAMAMRRSKEEAHLEARRKEDEEERNLRAVLQSQEEARLEAMRKDEEEERHLLALLQSQEEPGWLESSCCQEGLEEAQRQEAQRIEEARREAEEQEALREEEARRKAQRQEAQRIEEARREAEEQEALREEEVRRKEQAQRQEAQRIEEARREAEEQEALREEEARREAQRQQAIFVRNPMNQNTASDWGICGRQLNGLSHDVQSQFRADRANPSVDSVVTEYIIPKCTTESVSYAVLMNPQGLKCVTFVSHAWFGSFLGLIDGLQQCYEDFETRVFWIDFLAAPLTWPPSQVSLLMGASAVHWPFATALRHCQDVAVVRSTVCNMYTRLQCVAELVLARHFEKPVKVIGSMPPRAESTGDGIGIAARCSAREDEDMLRAAILNTSLDADALVAKAVTAPAGSELAVGATDFQVPSECCVQ